MSRRITVFLVATLVLVAYVAFSFVNQSSAVAPLPPLTRAAIAELGPDAVPRLRERSMSSTAESLDAVALSFLAQAESEEADALLVDLIQGRTEVDRNAALEMLLFELPDADRRLLTKRPKVRAALLERADSGSPKTRAFINAMRAEDGF